MNKEIIATFLPQRTFLVQGNEATYESLLASYLVDEPMTQSLMVPRFTMDHANTVVALAREATGEERTFVIYFSVFTPDAAHVLLKTLEEPDLQTTIILMTPYPYVVPKTIRSRVMLVHTTPEVGELTTMSRSSALSYIKENFGTESEDDAALRRAKGVAFLDSLELAVRTIPQKSRCIYEAKSMLFASNLPTKFVLEYAVTMVL